MTATGSRPDLREALRVALDRLSVYLDGDFDFTTADAAVEDREFILEARAALAATPVHPEPGLRTAIEALPGQWVRENAYPGDHRGIDYVDRSAVLALLPTDTEDPRGPAARWWIE